MPDSTAPERHPSGPAWCAICDEPSPCAASHSQARTAPPPADDLRERYAEALVRTRFLGGDQHTRAIYLAVARRDADAVLAVRDEELERLRAKLDRVIQGRTEAQLERNTERQRAERAGAKVASLQALADRCREKDWAYAAERTRERDEARAERDELKARVAEYENALNWQTSCLNCSRLLNASIADHERAEQAEAAVERVRALHSPEDDSYRIRDCKGCRTPASFVFHDRCPTLRALDTPESTEDAPTEDIDHE